MKYLIVSIISVIFIFSLIIGSCICYDYLSEKHYGCSVEKFFNYDTVAKSVLYQIVVDKQTGCLYIKSKSYGGDLFFTPILKEDGKPKNIKEYNSDR